jgi:hypothetical protein
LADDSAVGSPRDSVGLPGGVSIGARAWASANSLRRSARIQTPMTASVSSGLSICDRMKSLALSAMAISSGSGAVSPLRIRSNAL